MSLLFCSLSCLPYVKTCQLYSNREYNFTVKYLFTFHPVSNCDKKVGSLCLIGFSLLQPISLNPPGIRNFFNTGLGQWLTKAAEHQLSVHICLEMNSGNCGADWPFVFSLCDLETHSPVKCSPKQRLQNRLSVISKHVFMHFHICATCCTKSSNYRVNK